MQTKQTSQAGERTHTPGPWKVDGCKMTHAPTGVLQPMITHGDEQTVCPIIADVKFGGNEEQMNANARLMAAAPDMLDALNGLFRECAMMHKHWGDGCNITQANAAIAAATAAIAKATAI